MMTLDLDNIKIGSTAANKADAIREAANLLIQTHHIKPGYMNSMMEREKVANTFLGNGIAIPHGLPKDRDDILRTGIAVVQIPKGVEWNAGEIVHLVVGIAARSDEHIEVLSNLTTLLGDESLIQRLSVTSDPNDIIASLTQSAGTKPATPQLADFAMAIEVVIQGKLGLHARPAATFVEVAKQFAADVHVRYGEKVANGKSLNSLLQLGVKGGTAIRVMAQGDDAEVALAALKEAVAQGLGEEEEKPAEVVEHGWTPQYVGETIPGVPASPGLAIGQVRYFKHRKIVVETTAKDPQAEEERLNEAIAAAQVELEQLYEEVKERSGAGKASIFRAHAEFLADPDLASETLAYIRKGHSAGWAWQETIQMQVAALQSVDDPLLSARATDLKDVGTRVLQHLAGIVDDQPFVPDIPVILLAEDLTPSDTAKLNPEFILGFCTASGGPTSHTAIIARSLGIPAIVGTGPALLHQAEGTMAILDGNSGNLYLEPGDADIESARQAQRALENLRNEEFRTRFEPAITTDGHRLEVVANISHTAEAERAVNAGGEGVGLLRSEFLFLDREDAPSEAEQFTAYLDMVTALNGLPLIVRTLDIGGDKNAPYLNMPPEDNSFLGVRGIRLCLARPKLFKPQLRAIFRASQHGPVKIMFPMISTYEDLTAAREIAEQVRAEIGAPAVEIGIMIEVPSAVMMAEELAREVDFFSIGTNDLTQYTLAMDRLHPVLAKQADGLHPAVLRMIDKTVQAAKAAGKWVGVCGGIAGDPRGAVILAGLGVTEFSVSIPSIAAIKAKLRQISLTDAQAVAQKALSCRTAAEVRNLLLPM
ncbi:phosphoenolpyruvate-protein phosphotransferase [Candidatus Moduliflexus flocculans]|uniref:phosphoenolpyruvate--protein phosphotransferase n=1 Tax=Candidatus Moduliflexus flocculans TaxID=1499966 RepID=A0A0S6W3M1_9BACT|nr:phosphoenolpyruvate-protein phosphotransferase [Candidatus Moduliflexus flocculans]